MKLTLCLIALFTASHAIAAETAAPKTPRKTSSSSSAKPGHFYCSTSDNAFDAGDVQKILEASCDPTKNFTVSVDPNVYYTICCIHK